MQQGERKMKDYRQSPSFWPYALLSQRITLSPCRVSPFSRRVIFTCSCISLTLLSLSEIGDYSKSYYMQVEIASSEREETGLSKLWQWFLTLFNTRDREEKLVNSWPVRLPSNNPRNNKTYYGSNSLLRIKNKNALYLSVNVFGTKVLHGDTIFTSPTGDGTAILRGHLSHAKV